MLVPEEKLWVPKRDGVVPTGLPPCAELDWLFEELNPKLNDGVLETPSAGLDWLFEERETPKLKDGVLETPNAKLDWIFEGETPKLKDGALETPSAELD